VKKMRLLAFICSFFLIVTLSSCSVNEIIGNTPIDYSAEEPIADFSASEELISSLSDMIYALTIDSIKLPEFSDTASALSKCGDSLLNHLLTTNYSRFSGNTEVLKRAAKEYKNMNITAAIGESDYEGALYKYFNHGGNIRHESTARFKYLSKIDAYIPAVQAQANKFSLDIISVAETENTYRMSFYCSNGEEVSPEYLAVFVKRDKGGCYIQSLRQMASEKINYKIPPVFS